MLKGKPRFLAGFVIGAMLGGAVMTQISARADEHEAGDRGTETRDNLALTEDERHRLVRYLTTFENVVVSLAVDTERSAIGIAELNGRLRKIERRLTALEGQLPTRPPRDR